LTTSYNPLKFLLDLKPIIYYILHVKLNDENHSRLVLQTLAILYKTIPTLNKMSGHNSSTFLRGLIWR